MRKTIASKITPNRKLIRKSASRQDLRVLSEKVNITTISYTLFLEMCPHRPKCIAIILNVIWSIGRQSIVLGKE